MTRPVTNSWFLSIAAQQGYVVDRYSDAATGVMTRNATGKLWMSLVTLRPEVAFCGGDGPTGNDLLQLHHRAHMECFIANSVKSEVRCEPVSRSSAR